MLNYLFSLQEELADDTGSELSANRSFLFGDGFFETIRLNHRGIMPLASYHAARIARSAALLQFTGFESFGTDGLHALLRRIPESRDWKGMKLKLVFYRHGSGGYGPEIDSITMVYASASPLNLPFISRINTIAVAESVRIFPSQFSPVKSTSALPYVMAGIERKRKSCDEIMLLSPEGFVVEGSFTSICWEDEDGIHFTPRHLGGIDSCSRRFLEDYFQTFSIPVSEKQIKPEELVNRSRWICFSSALGLRFLTSNSGDPVIPEVFASSELDVFN
jgi:branched-subunit amino acid aminotransferase/4-amino-4-deoxychorismate lyase